jgi:CubicO group peptidase (beta-lactamase class C family)
MAAVAALVVGTAGFQAQGGQQPLTTVSRSWNKRVPGLMKEGGKPLGMTNSSYVWRPSFDSLTATGYDPKGKPDDLVKPKEAGAASTLNTTARDYALFVDAILKGKGLSSSVLREMETPQVALDPTCRICIKQEPKELSKSLFWGLGWGIQREDNVTMLWHWGDNGVFKAFVMADPARKSGVVMFAMDRMR